MVSAANGGSGLRGRALLSLAPPSSQSVELSEIPWSFSPQEGNPLASALDGFGADGTASVTLGPGWLVQQEGTGDGPLKLGWLEVESNRRLDGWLILEGNLGTAVVAGSPDSRRETSVPILNSTAPFGSTGLILANPSQDEVAVDLTLHEQDGGLLAEEILVLSAKAQRVRFLQDIDWLFQSGKAVDLANFRGLVRAHSSAPLVSAQLHLRPGAFALTR